MKRILLALAALFFCTQAEAAGCFWVGGTGTWDGTNTGGGGAGGIKWASATGGGTACAATSGPAAGVPGPSDTVTFDANSGGGTVTVSPTGTGLGITSLTAGAFTGTLDFSVSNPSMTLTGAFNISGNGARKILMGTTTITSNVTNVNNWDLGTTTNLDALSDFSSMTFIVGTCANINAQQFVGGGKTYGTLTVNAKTSFGCVTAVTGNNTFATVNLNGPLNIQFGGGSTTTITNAVNWAGSSSAPLSLATNNAAATATIQANSGATISWAAITRLTFLQSGGSACATCTATNSFDLKSNTNITISGPSSGGGGRIIGG